MPAASQRSIMPILILALLLGGLVRAASAVELIRNGDFSAGIAEWRIGDGISPTWDPLSSGNGTVSLHPSTMGMYMGGYSGPVLSQELNVTGIGGRQVDLGFDLSADSQPPAGSAIQTRIVYLDAAGVERMATLSTSVNSSVAVAPAAPSRVTGSHIFPADAARLVRFLFFKNAYGSFSADNVSLAMNGVTVGPLPQITGLSAATAAHGESLTISGQNFGAGNGASSVRIDGSPAGVTVNSWTDTAIGITVNAPAGSGPVEVVADGVTSANESQLDITSPYFLITGTRDRFKVLQGTEVNIPLGAVFANGYTPPAGGLTWSVTDSAGAPLPASFSPATLFGEGGTILTVDTTQIPAGEHQVRVGLSDGTSQLSGSGHLHILTVGSTSFEQCVMDQNPPYTTTCNPVTSLMANRYGRINNGVNPLVTDNEGNTIENFTLFTTGMTVTTSDPALLVYDLHTPWDGPEVWAIGNPAANPVDVAVHFADGSSASLPVFVNIPATPALSIGVAPPTVTNLHGDPILISLSGDNVVTWDGSRNYNMSFPADPTNSPAYDTSHHLYSGAYKLDLSQGPVPTGTTIFTGGMDDGQGGFLAIATPFTITNDPSLAAAAGFVTSIDPGLDPYVLEHFTLEFHTAGGLQFSREVFNAHSADGGFHVDGLTPGTYSVRCVVDAFINGQQRQMVQWYPNSPDQAGAQPVDFAAGGVVGNLNFFFMAPPIPHFAIGGHISNADASPYNGDVELLDSYASAVATTTAANGDYLFPSIPEGNYTVRPAVGQGSVSVNLLGADSLANDFIVSPTALTFHGHLVMTDPGGPVMGWTGALAYLTSAPSYDIYTTGGDCTAENTATLNDCTGVRLDLANLSLSFFELTNGGDGDHRVYSNATATVKDGQNNVLFTSDNLNISMDLVYSTNTSAGAGVAALAPNTPAASSLRDEIGGPAGQVEFVFTSLSPVVQGQFGVFEFTLEVRPAASPMPAVSFANLPYVQMEDGGSQQVTVSLSAPPTRTVAVDYTTGDNTAVNGTDYTAASGTLVWQPNDPQTKTFPVPILADASPEADETYTLTLANPVNCLLAGPNPVQATITEQAPGISFSGAVTDINNQPLQGILVEQVGAAPANSTTSGQNGAFTLGNLPIATPFHLRMSGGGFASSYSALMNSNVDITAGGTYTMYLPAKLTDWGITPGTGVIRSRVVDLADAFVGGAVVTATGQQGGSYTVCYDDACTPGLTATDSASGRYMVKDVLDGDTVTVSAAKANWIFRPRTFHTHADGVSMSKIRGFDSVAAEAALRQGLQAAIDALNRHDQAGYDAFAAFVSLSYLNSGETRDMFLADATSMPPGTTISFTIQSVQFNGDLATVALIWHDHAGDEAETLIFRLEGGTFKLFGDQLRHGVHVYSGHWPDGYHAQFHVEDTPGITAVTVSGPGITAVLALSHHPGGGWWYEGPDNPNLGTTPVSPAPTYTVTVTDSGGDTPYTRQISGWMTEFATNLAPTGVAEGAFTFSWTGTGEAMRYAVELNDSQYNRIWNQYDVPATTLAVPYNGPPLVEGQQYIYWIVAQGGGPDMGNSSFAEGRFTYRSHLYGDIDGQTGVTLRDAILSQQIGVDRVPLGSSITPAGDTNGDGRIGPSDAPYILRRLGGM